MIPMLILAAALPLPALAQSMPGMPGMGTPAKPAAKPKPKPRPAPRRVPSPMPKPTPDAMPDVSVATTPSDTPPPAAPAAPETAPAQPMAGMDMSGGMMTNMPGMTMEPTFGEGSGTARNPAPKV